MKEYFPHDGGARRDPKVLALCMKYGIEGYGIYFMILEMIFEGKLYRITDHNIKAMAYDIRIDEKKLVVIMEYLSSEECGLMEKRDGFYFSKRMNDTLDNIKKISKINRDNVNKRHNRNKLEGKNSNKGGNTTEVPPKYHRSTTVVPEENTILNDTIVHNSIIEGNESKEEKLAKRELKFRNYVIEYNHMHDDKYPQWMIDEFLDYFTEPNKSKTKMAFELNKTWETGRRLATWHRRSNKFRALDSRESNTEELNKFLNE